MGEVVNLDAFRKAPRPKAAVATPTDESAVIEPGLWPAPDEKKPAVSKRNRRAMALAMTIDEASTAGEHLQAAMQLLGRACAMVEHADFDEAEAAIAVASGRLEDAMAAVTAAFLEIDRLRPRSGGKGGAA